MLLRGYWHGASFVREAPRSYDCNSETEPLVSIIHRGQVFASENRPTPSPIPCASRLTQTVLAVFLAFLQLLGVGFLGVELLLQVADCGFGDRSGG